MASTNSAPPCPWHVTDHRYELRLRYCPHYQAWRITWFDPFNPDLDGDRVDLGPFDDGDLVVRHCAKLIEDFVACAEADDTEF